MFVGIDVGGTNLKAGLVDQEGHLLAAARRPLSGFTGAEDFATDLTELVLQAAKEGGVGVEALESVGIGLPGAVDGGNVLFTTNIPMENVPLAKLFRQRLDVPVYLGNDADCAAVGEFFGGAGRGCRDFVVVTLGTGIGAGIILDGKLRGGLASSEAGHMVIQQGGEPCNCGRRGCWERYASATALRPIRKAVCIRRRRPWAPWTAAPPFRRLWPGTRRPWRCAASMWNIWRTVLPV